MLHKTRLQLINLFLGIAFIFSNFYTVARNIVDSLKAYITWNKFDKPKSK